MTKLLTALVLAVVLAGCSNPTIQKIFPYTTTGFEQGGIVGGVGGFVTGTGELAKQLTILCQTFDGTLVELTLNVVSEAANVSVVPEVIRSICEQSGYIAALAPLAAPLPAVKP